MSIKSIITGKAAKAIFNLKAKSPQILLGVGIVGIATGTVMACKATIKVHDQLEEDILDIEDIKVSTPNDKKAIAKAYSKVGKDIIKAYALPVGVLAISIGCIVKGHKILTDNNAKLLGAYKLLEAGYNRYRSRVVDEYGEETDKMFYHNLSRKDIEIKEDGKTKKVKNAEVLDEMDNPIEVSYDRVFDENNHNWSGHPDMDIMFLKQTQNWANDVLNSRGFIFLNEVYGELGFGPCEAGQFVGWVKEHNGDGYVDFGIMDIFKKSNRDFINGYTPHVLLTFNVDGYIADKI